MRTVLLATCLLFASVVAAQRPCASVDYIVHQKSADPSLSNRLAAVEDFIRNQAPSATLARITGQNVKVIRIPVVVHVLYKTQSQNISEEQIKSQITALNRDFRRDNADSVNTPARFRGRAVDVQIEFYLATADPQGRPTSGIVRRQTNVNIWSMDDRIKFTAQGGDDAWDSRYYLNFWVGNLFGLLGYASVPGGPAEKDGIVINTTAFGTINTAAPYQLGRTAVHEAGHWLGLKHIWGDSYCGDDLVDDTPKQGNFTSGCPGSFRTTCNNGSEGDMYMNYMDFTDDACLNLFTEGQKKRMLSLFNAGGPRNSLLSSKGLEQPWTAEAPVHEALPPRTRFSVFPNPAGKEIVMDFEFNTEWIGKSISIVNINGTVLSRIQISSKNQKVSIADLKPGLYFIQGETGRLRISERLVKL